MAGDEKEGSHGGETRREGKGEGEGEEEGRGEARVASDCRPALAHRGAVSGVRGFLFQKSCFPSVCIGVNRYV